MINIYFGSPGCGKTTHIMYCIKKQIKYLSGFKYKLSKLPLIGSYFVKSDSYYTNVKDCVFPYYPSSELGKTVLPSGSTYYLDEAGIDFNNRKYKTLPIETISYLKLHRHYGHDINIYSQSWEDMDITMRRLADNLYYLRKIGPFTLCRKVRKRCTIDKNTEQIIDGYKFTGILWRLIPSCLGGFKSFYFVFRPKYYKYFDSYAVENPLPEYKPTPQAVTTPARRRTVKEVFALIKEKYFNYLSYRFPWLTDDFRGVSCFDNKG